MTRRIRGFVRLVLTLIAGSALVGAIASQELGPRGIVACAILLVFAFVEAAADIAALPDKSDAK